MMFIRNSWYVGAWSHEFAGETMLARKLLGERVLFFRTSAGRAVAMQDRCSHRFAPLSIGRKEGDTVRCMYHGLVFDEDGKCIEEPGRTRCSPGLDIRTYPVVERWKQAWVWMGDPALADPDLIPDCHEQDSPEWASNPAYLHYKADYLLILDNLLDFSHLSFVHENTLGGSRSIAEIKPKVEKIEGGVRLTRWYINEPALPPFLSGFETFSGPVDRWHIYELTTCGNVFSMESGFSPAGTGAPEGHRAPETMLFHATQITTPEDARNSHFFWTYAHNFNLDDREFTKNIAERILEGFHEDRAMIEAQQKAVDEDGEAGMGYIFADNALSLGRRLITEALDREAQQSESLREVAPV